MKLTITDKIWKLLKQKNPELQRFQDDLSFTDKEIIDTLNLANNVDKCRYINKADSIKHIQKSNLTEKQKLFAMYMFCEQRLFEITGGRITSL